MFFHSVALLILALSQDNVLVSVALLILIQTAITKPLYTSISGIFCQVIEIEHVALRIYSLFFKIIMTSGLFI